MNFYRECLKIRRSSKTLVYGIYREFFHGSRNIYMYERARKKVRYLIICSFAHIPFPVKLPKNYEGMKGSLIIHNYADARADNMIFRPYEARVYRFDGRDGVTARI